MTYLTTDAIKQLIVNLEEKGSIFETSFANTVDLLREGSYLFYEFRDKEIIQQFDENHPEYGEYTKYISPLYTPAVINDSSNEELLGIITEETPFYHLEPSKEVTLDTEPLSSTRDAGINDVPSALQTNEFYNVWFRESQGYIQNLVLLDVYNKLRWPFINENQYLNANLFPVLASENFGSAESEDALIEFKTSAEENEADNNFIENGVHSKIGCIDYLNNIVNQKLQSTYNLVDYNTKQTNLLSSWVESKYESGEIPYEEVEAELSIYKLQDIKYELLRRKFAGSKTLYELALASVDRQGTFANTIPLGSLSTSSVPFKDKRLARLLNLPGLLTTATDLSSLKFIDTYYTTPSEEETTQVLPLGTLSPLFYTSATQDVEGNKYYYTAEQFYSPLESADETYRNFFLRDGSKIIDWNSIKGVVVPEALVSIYDTLDEKIATTETTEGWRYRTLDDEVLKDEDDPKSGSEALSLDRKRPLLDTFIAAGNILDVTANRLLYNKNTLQALQQDAYPYLTYSIAEENSVSLIDDPWLEYFREATEKKSRVQDKVLFGTQVNKVDNLEISPTGEYYFFNVSQRAGEERFLLLRYCTIKYNVYNYRILSFSSDIISKITLRVKEEDEDYKLYNSFRDIDSCEALFNYNIGVLPFTYPNLKGVAADTLRLGVFKDQEISPSSTETIYNFHDDISRLGYTKAMFVFGLGDLVKNTASFNTDPAGVSDNQLTITYSDDIRNIFYVVRKGLFTNEDGTSSNKYLWSDPIKVMHFSEEELDAFSRENLREALDFTFKPEWLNLGYFFNPYLNFTEKSASPLRHKEVNPSLAIKQSDIPQGEKEALLEGPSSSAALSNLTRTRSMESTCNDSGQGTLPMEWVNPNNNNVEKEIYGFYLNRYHLEELPEGEAAVDYREYSYVYGDNRTPDIFDGVDIYETGIINRTEIYQDDVTKIPCLKIGKGTVTPTSTNIAPNYFKLLPCKDRYLHNSFKEASMADCNAIIVEIIGDGTEGNPGTLNELLEKYCSGEHIEDILAKDIAERTSYEQRAVRLYETLQEAERRLAELIADPTTDREYEEKIWKNWWWNREATGISVFMHLAPSLEEIEEGSILLIRRESEFSLEMNITEDSVTISFTLEPSRTITSGNLLREGVLPTSLRIAASSQAYIDPESGDTFTTLCLIVNDNLFEATETLEGYYLPVKSVSDVPLEGIEIGCHSYHDPETGKLIQSNSFFGEIYDLRLYNEGLSSINLRLLSEGSLRELFSYSPAPYILGYNLYRSLGIFKEVNLREGLVELPEIRYVRLFNRAVWDSILLDMYPVSAEEQIDTSYRYRKDSSDSRSDVDVYGMVDGVLGLDDCIEQRLEDIIEVKNSALLTDNTTKVNYNNISWPTLTGEANYFSLVNTTLYPVEYNKATFSSGTPRFKFLDDEKTILGTISGYEIELPAPVNPSDGILSYDADVDLNFTISPEFDFSVWYSHGAYISLDYSPTLDATIAKFTVIGNGTSVEATSNSQTNHILVPLTVPEQPDLDSYAVGYLDRLYLKGVQLNQGLVSFLRASTYYNELRIPVLQDIVTEDRLYSTPYASKWDAIRTLKEGTYYFTCKYPFQILPFNDYLFDTNASAKYATLYGSVRFKVEVSGECVEYSYKELRESNYYSETINSYLRSSSALEDPQDNRTFTHRRINIDLYVQDIEGTAGLMKKTSSGAEENYTFTWKLLASNHPGDFYNDDIIHLTKGTIAAGLAISEDIPVFFSKNYLSPFFIGKTEKTINGFSIINSASSDDDLINPIRINPSHERIKYTKYLPATGVAIYGVTYYSDTKGTLADPQPNYETSDSVEGLYTKMESIDRIEVSAEEDLDHLILAAGRTYNLLWDYTGNVSEIAFTDNIYSQEAAALRQMLGSKGLPAYKMTDAEKINFARLATLTDDKNPADYSYITDGLSYYSRDINVVGKTTGYKITSTKYTDATLYTGELIAPEELLNNFPGEAVTGYKSCIVLPYEPEFSGEVGYVYYDDEEEKHYIWAINEEFTLEYTYKEITPLPLDITQESVLNTYYEYDENPKNIYIGIISLDTRVFLDTNENWWVWDDTNYTTSSLIAIENLANLPYPGITNAVYFATAEAQYCKCTTVKPHFTGVSETGVAPFYYGNPYSKSSANNYLLAIRNIDNAFSRYNINNSYFFPYEPTEVAANHSLSSQPIIGDISTKRTSAGDIAYISLNETDIIKSQYSNMAGNISYALREITKNTSGLLTALSKASPNIHYVSYSYGRVAENTYIRPTNSTLHAYHASERIVPSKNTDIKIARRGLYSNNLLTYQDFGNGSVWSWRDEKERGQFSNSYTKGYVSDTAWKDGKDVYEIKYYGLRDNISGIFIDSNEANTLLMEYYSGSQVIAAAYESALNIKVLSDENYPERIYKCIKEEDSYSYEEVAREHIHYLTSEKLVSVEGINGDYYIYKPTSTGYIYSDGTLVINDEVYSEGYYSIDLKSYDASSIPTIKDIKTIFVDSPVNLLEVYAYYYQGDALVGKPQELTVTSTSHDGALASKGLFTDQWYVASCEADVNLPADHVAFGFTIKGTPGENIPLSFRITKAVVRRSSATSHTLGLSDCIYTTSTSTPSSNVVLSGYTTVVFRDNTTEELIPVQFKNSIYNRPGTAEYSGAILPYPVSGLRKVDELIQSCSLGFPTSTSKLETLFNPWTRRIHYRRTLLTEYVSGYYYQENFWEDISHTKYIAPDILKTYYDLETKYFYSCVVNTLGELEYVLSTPHKEEAYFTKYEVSYNDLRIPSKVENKIPMTDIFTTGGISYHETDTRRYLSVNYLNLTTDTSSLLKYYKTNLQITSEYEPPLGESGLIIAAGPVTLTNETLSALTNCFNPKDYRAGKDSLVSVTNIQFLAEPNEGGKYERILYELEYLPLVYKENKNHLSVNTLLIHGSL